MLLLLFNFTLSKFLFVVSASSLVELCTLLIDESHDICRNHLLTLYFRLLASDSRYSLPRLLVYNNLSVYIHININMSSEHLRDIPEKVLLGFNLIHNFVAYSAICYSKYFFKVPQFFVIFFFYIERNVYILLLYF